MELNLFLKLNQNLMDSSMHIRKNAIETIVNHVETNNESFQCIIDAGIISNLIKLLDSSLDDELCKLILNIFQRISEGSEIQKQAIIDEGSVAIFVKFLQSDEEGIYVMAEKILKNLCYIGRDQQLVIIDKEGINALTELLTVKNEKICCTAMDILEKISSGINEQKESIIQAGALPLLMKFINSSNKTICQKSIECLKEICVGNPEHSQAIIDAGLIPALMTYYDLLMEPLDVADSYICSLLVTMLSTICEQNSKLKQIVKESELLSMAEKVLNYEKVDEGNNPCHELMMDEEMSKSGDRIYGLKLSESDSSGNKKKRLVPDIISNQTETTDLLKNYLAQLTSEDSETCRTGLKNLLSAIAANDNLVFKHDLLKRIQQQSVKLLTHQDINNCKDAARLVRYFCAQGEIETLAEAGVISHLVELLGLMDLNISKEAVECLFYITGSTNKLRQEVIDAGALPYLMIMLGSSDTDICSIAANICTNLSAKTTEMKQYVYEAGAIPLLIRFFESPYLELRMSAFWTASLFSNGTEDHRKALIEAGAIQNLLSLYESPDFKSKKGQITGTLSNIATLSSAIKNLIIQNDGLSHLVQGISVPGSKECYEALLAVRNFSYGSEEVREAIINAGAIPYLIRLLESTNSPYCTHVLVALKNLESSSTCDMLVKSGAIPLIMKFLFFPETEMCVNAVYVLSHIAKHSDEYRNILINSDIVTYLSTFLNLPFNDVCIAACVLVQHLSVGSPKYRKLLIKNRVVESLRLLLKCPDMEVVVIAATTLANICISAEQEDIQKYVDVFVELIHDKYINNTLAPNSLQFKLSNVALIGLNNIIGITINHMKINYALALLKFATILKSSNTKLFGMTARIISAIAIGNNKERQMIIDAGIIPLLIKLLEYSDADFCKECIEAMGNIATQGIQQKKIIVEAGVIPTLEKFLHFDNFDIIESAASAIGNLIFIGIEQKESLNHVVSRVVELLAFTDQIICTCAARVIANFATGSSDLKQILINANAVPALLKLLEFTDSTKFKFATAALANIADGSYEQKRVLIDAGVIPFFVQGLNFPNTCLESARGITNLIDANLSEIQIIIGEKALPKLCELITSSNSQIFEQAAFALRNIARGTMEQKQAIIDAGVLLRIAEHLNAFISKKDEQEDEDNQVPKKIFIDNNRFILDANDKCISSLKQCEKIMDILLNISDSSLKQHEAIVEAKILPCLVKLLNPSFATVCKRSVYVLKNMATTTKREDIIKAGAVFPLTKLLGSSEFEICAADAMRSIVFNSLNGRDALIEAGALPLLVSLLNSTDAKSCENAAWVLVELSEGIPNQADKVISAGALPRFVELLSSEDKSLCEVAVTAILTLSKGFPQQLEDVFNAGVINPLVKLLSNPKIGGIAAGAISFIVADKEEYVNTIIDAEAITPLVKLLVNFDLNVCHAALTAITNICKTRKGAISILKSNAPADLLLLLHSSNSEICETAFKALFNILRDINLKNITPHFILSFVELLGNNNFNLHNELIMLISHIACASDQNRKKLIEAGTIPIILQFLSQSSAEIRASVIRALANMVRDTAENIDEFLNAGKIPEFTSFLNESNQEICRSTAILFSNIACCSEKHKQLIIDSNVIPRLIELIQSDDLLTTEYTANVLKHIVNGTATQCQNVVEEGAVPHLVRLLLVHSLTANEIAANILKDILSHKFDNNKTTITILRGLQDGVEIGDNKGKVIEMLKKIECPESIQNLLDHEDNEISTAASNLIWALLGE